MVFLEAIMGNESPLSYLPSYLCFFNKKIVKLFALLQFNGNYLLKVASFFRSKPTQAIE